MKTWHFKETSSWRDELDGPRRGMWYSVGNWKYQNGCKDFKLGEVVVQYGPGMGYVVLRGRAMRSFVWHLWPWCMADKWSVGQDPGSLFEFLISTCLFFCSCHLSPFELCPNSAQFRWQTEKAGKQLTSWHVGSMRFLHENDILKDRRLILSHATHSVSSVQSLSHVWFFGTPWIAALQASLSITNSRSLLNSCPLSRWCHPVISSSVVPFSSCPQSLPASGSFPMSQLFAWGGQSIGISASASVLPMNTQDWSPLGWTGCISLQSKGLSRVFSNTIVQKHQFFGTQLSSQSNSHIHTWPLEKP